MEVFVARHPVFDAQKEVHGYELGFRCGFDEYYQALNADKPDVDLMAFVNFGELTDGKKGFVSFPRRLLEINFPVLFDNRSLVAGVAAELDCDEGIVARCKELRGLGYPLAIDGFVPGYADSPLLELAEFAKVDFAKASPESRQAIPSLLAGKNVQAVARNVQTPEQYQEAVAAGYACFHGDFFTKPTVRPNREIAANKLTYLQLVREVNSPSLSYEEISALVERDVAMTYKLLRFMNSAWFGLRFEIRSVKHALVLLGPKEIRRWISLVAVRSTGDDKPQELLLRSLTRAKAAEQIGMLTDMGKESSELFLMGMFSVIDALTDSPMEEVLDKLPLQEGIKKALTGGTGVYRSVYDAVLAYEKGDWPALSEAAAAIRLDEAQVPAIFRNSLKWASQALKEV
jgi:EAL and modified HD-GYP domain-containing signal transduction protein